jgi:hypothetical protein
MKLIRRLEFWLVTLLLVAVGVAHHRQAANRYVEIIDNAAQLTNPAELDAYLGSVNWVLHDFGGRMLPFLGLYVAWLLVHFWVDFRRKNWASDVRSWLGLLAAFAVLVGGVWGYRTVFRTGYRTEPWVLPTPADSTARTRLDSVLVPEGVPATAGAVTEVHITQRTARTDSNHNPWNEVLILLFVLVGYEVLAQFVYVGYGALMRQAPVLQWNGLKKVVGVILIWITLSFIMMALGILPPHQVVFRPLVVFGIPIWYLQLLILRDGLLKHFRGEISPSLFIFGFLVSPALCIVGVIGALSLGVHATGAIFLIIWILSLLAVFPSAVYLFRQGQQTLELQTDLGQNQAELAGLKAQLNPHFLFNALNTLYASALQEGGERTAEGIQRLGDLMRFMLHDNARDRIELSREIEYLRQYVDLQRLRIGDAETVDIRLNLPEAVGPNQVPPMLLIPFVENAFKHGISLRRSSWIEVELHCEPDRVTFRVANSKHVRTGDQPEAESSGIGLENVRKRLELLYPNRHTLTIHETGREFSVVLELKT